jgi:glycosyltransferase involved in cell wall biosynthesis
MYGDRADHRDDPIVESSRGRVRTIMAQDGVTIAIPNWNHEILLPRSILSALRARAILHQRGVPAEVLVIDDYSRDGSLTLLRQLEALYHKDGFRYLAFASNGGLSASRNQALANARHRYVAFVDADNELIPENLPLFVQTLRETKAAVAYGTLLIRTPTAGYAHNVLSNESIQGRLFQGNYVDAFSVVDRLQLLDVGGYEVSYRAVEDYELWQHLATNGRRMVFVPVTLGYYYALPGSMGRNEDAERAFCQRNRRIFDQVNTRRRLRMNTDQLRYHPELGYL